MKALDSFTVERLEEIRNSFLDRIQESAPSIEEVFALIDIALAAKRAEPVTWWTGPEPTLTGEIESFHDHETGSHYLPLISLSTTSYAALSREKFIFKVTNFLCTRRQSIAREGETAALIYDMLTTPPLNSPEIPEGWIKCSDRMPEDCQTVLCNNMLTELSGIPFIADYVGMFDLHDGTKYEAGFYINRIPITVTHWMPLPAPPEKPL